MLVARGNLEAYGFEPLHHRVVKICDPQQTFSIRGHSFAHTRCRRDGAVIFLQRVEHIAFEDEQLVYPSEACYLNRS